MYDCIYILKTFTIILLSVKPFGKSSLVAILFIYQEKSVPKCGNPGELIGKSSLLAVLFIYQEKSVPKCGNPGESIYSLLLGC